MHISIIKYCPLVCFLYIALPLVALANWGYCNCTLTSGETVLLKFSSLGCDEVPKFLQASKTGIFTSCTEVSKFEKESACSCKPIQKFNNVDPVTPSQSFCSTLSNYLIKNNFSTEQCTWKVPEGYMADEKKKIQLKPVSPSLAIAIPGFKGFSNLSPTPDEQGGVNIPFLAQYLSAVYTYLISIAGIIAAVIILFSGFQWMMAGGNAQLRADARERIEGAVIGLILVFGSYVVLYIINPDLVKFKSLRIPIIQTVALEDADFPERGEIIGTPKALSDTTYDGLFQKFAGCIGMDWRVYKALAYHESRFNPAAKSSKSSATGLFQVLNGYCERILQKVGWDGYCQNPGRTNPAVNAAIVTQGHFKMALRTISGKCPNASVDDQLHMLLFNNGSGPGALRKAINNYGCATSAWAAHPEIFKAASYENGVKTVKLMRSMGVTSLTGSKDSAQCPFNAGMKPSDFPS